MHSQPSPATPTSPTSPTPPTVADAAPPALDPAATEPAAVLQRWGLAAPSHRGPKARVRLEDVAEAAVRLADADGFHRVTLAAVAERIGLTTTGIYRYVDSKDTLLELMVDRALEVPLPTPAGSPRDDVRQWVDGLWSIYAAHPWLATFPLQRPPRCPNAFGWLDALVRPLEQLGLADPVSVALGIDVLVRGYAAMTTAAEHDEMSPRLAAEVVRRHPSLRAAGARDSSVRADLDAMVDRLLPQG